MAARGMKGAIRFCLATFRILCIVGTALYAAPPSKVEIVADEVERNASRTVARGDAVVHYDLKSIASEHIVYDEAGGVLKAPKVSKLFDAEGDSGIAFGIQVNTLEDTLKAKDLLLYMRDDIWLFALEANKTDANITLSSAFVSSCNIRNPLWKIYFEKALYDTKANYLRMQNAKLYIKEVPLLFSPYLAFSLNQKRSTGFLFPTFGYNRREGFVYEQPFFWAIDPTQDLEINPQLRTKRSLGVYATYRFVDSPRSGGKFRIGYFKDSDAYVRRYNAQEKKHYGAEFQYASSNVLGKYRGKNAKEGLYIDTIYLNDIDYINLQSQPMRHFGLTPLQESRLNYFWHNDIYYAGLNAKYFIDTRKENNADTLQILPSMQLHRFYDKVLYDWFYTGVDLKSTRLTREEGVGMKQFELKLPFDFAFNFFENMLTFSFGEELYATRIFFDNEALRYENFRYSSVIHKFALRSDLYKRYGEVLHFFQPAILYLKPGSEKASPVTFEALDEASKALFSVGLPEEQIRFALNHYFYDNKGNLKFFQRLSQIYYTQRKYRFSQIENEMMYRWRNWHLYSEAIYVPQFEKFRRISSRIGRLGSDLSWNLGHTYTRALPDRPDDVEADDLYFDFAYRWDERWRFYGAAAYSLERQQSRYWRAGGRYEVDCWSIEGGLRREVVPRPNGFSNEDGIYLQVSFIPFGTFGTGER